MDWHVAYVLRMENVVDALLKNVRTKNGAKTEDALLKMGLIIAMNVKKNAGQDCLVKLSHTGLRYLLKDMV